MSSSQKELLVLIVTSLCVISLAIVFTLFYLHYYKNSLDAIKEGRRDIELIDDNINEQIKAKSKKHKAFKIAMKVLSYLISAMVLAIFIIALINRFSGGDIVVGNSTVIVVKTGSMSEVNAANKEELTSYDNQIPTWSLIGISKVNEEDLKPYDVIAFHESNSNQIIIHRIIDIMEDANGHYYVTRGDALASEDGYHPRYEAIIGRYNNFHIPYVGLFIYFLQTNSGIVTILSIIYCLVLFGVLSDKIAKKEKERKDELISVIDIDLAIKEVNHDIIEKIYYHGYVYSFKNNEFISKEKILEGDEHLPSKKNELIKVIENQDETKVMSSIIEISFKEENK